MVQNLVTLKDSEESLVTSRCPKHRTLVFLGEVKQQMPAFEQRLCNKFCDVVEKKGETSNSHDFKRFFSAKKTTHDFKMHWHRYSHWF